METRGQIELSDSGSIHSNETWSGGASQDYRGLADIVEELEAIIVGEGYVRKVSSI